MSEQPDRLVLTVDVECDSDGGPTWQYASPVSFRGIEHGLGEVLAPMLEKTGAVATLLVSNVVMQDEKSVAHLRDMARVELGAHLHGDFLPPNPRFSDPSGAKTVENQNEYTEEVERAKLQILTAMFRDAFGRSPTAFRAGRWSAGGRSARLLSEMGYLVDSSVTPHVHWADGGRSIDYRRAPEQPYHPSAEDISQPGGLPLWELPVSIVPRWWLAGRAGWLRPSLSSVATMRWIVRSLGRRYPAPRTFVLMFHNNELTPGTSPYSRTPDDAAKVTRRLEEFLLWTQDQRSMTLTEAAVSDTSE